MAKHCLMVLAAALIALRLDCSGPEFCNPADSSTECGLTYALTGVPAARAVGTSAAPATSCAELSSCIIFITAATLDGTLNGQPGVAGADSRCNADANKPAGSVGGYKAMIVGGLQRRASQTAFLGDGQIDWVLYANKEYRRPDGTVIGVTSNVRLFTFPLTNAVSAVDIPGTVVWTGLFNSWTTSGNICLTWTDNTVGQNGNTATEFEATNTAIQSGNFNCSNMQALYCVQQ